MKEKNTWQPILSNLLQCGAQLCKIILIQKLLPKFTSNRDSKFKITTKMEKF